VSSCPRGTILIETLPYVRSVALGYYLRSGSAVESEKHSGAAHFLEHLVFKGTATRSTADIAKVIDILGGDVDAFTGKEYTSFYCHVLDEQMMTSLSLLTDIVISPRFTTTTSKSSAASSSKRSRWSKTHPTAFWPDHPLVRQEYYFGKQLSLDEIIAAIDNVSLDDIANVANTIVDPDSISLTLIGNLNSPGVTTDMLRAALA
jgi:predicted Zn-dependent peptidase